MSPTLKGGPKKAFSKIRSVENQINGPFDTHDGKNNGTLYNLCRIESFSTSVAVIVKNII